MSAPEHDDFRNMAGVGTIQGAEQRFARLFGLVGSLEQRFKLMSDHLASNEDALRAERDAFKRDVDQALQDIATIAKNPPFIVDSEPHEEDSLDAVIADMLRYMNNLGAGGVALHYRKRIWALKAV